MTSENNPNVLTYSGANYLMEVKALTKSHDENSFVSSDKQLNINQEHNILGLAIFSPFIIFLIIFVSAFGIQIINRILSRKQIISALVIALMLASIPTILNSIRSGVRFTQYASPDETPINLKVEMITTGSIAVTWQTNIPKTGGLKIAPYPLKESDMKFYIANEGKTTINHQVKLENLDRRSYVFEILSGTSWYNHNGSYLRFDIR